MYKCERRTVREVTTLPNAITGIDDHLSLHLASAIRRSDSIRLIVSFVRESGAVASLCSNPSSNPRLGMT